MTAIEILLIYFAAISAVAVFLTIKDKRAAKADRWRVKEATLFTVAAILGAPAMYITMLSIHHKTRHKRFMLGLPAMILIQLALVVAGILLFA